MSETQLVTDQQVREACLAAGITRIDHHECSLCNVMTFYSVVEGDLFFNSGCGCSWSPPQPQSWQDAADWINMQSMAKWREEFARRFGLDFKPAAF